MFLLELLSIFLPVYRDVGNVPNQNINAIFLHTLNGESHLVSTFLIAFNLIYYHKSKFQTQCKNIATFV